jgi:hypothetical protein
MVQNGVASKLRKFWLTRSCSFETRSLPNSLATTHRGFAFYVAFPKSSIRPLGLTHLYCSHMYTLACAERLVPASTDATQEGRIDY